jgi:hypothetical protein
MDPTTDLEARVDRLERSLRRSRLVTLSLALVAGAMVWTACSSSKAAAPAQPLQKLELGEGDYKLLLEPGRILMSSPTGTLDLRGDSIVIGGEGGKGSTGVSRTGVLVVGDHGRATLAPGELELESPDGARAIEADVAGPGSEDHASLIVRARRFKVNAVMHASDLGLAYVSAGALGEVDAPGTYASMGAYPDETSVFLSRGNHEKSIKVKK